MTYSIEFVDDGDLPDNQDWAMVEVCGSTVLFMKESAVSAEAMAEAWAGFRKLDRHRTPCRELLLRVS